jgi:pyruvate,water dikinase
VLGYVQRFWTLRDDQRYAFERLVMAKKRAVREIGRRAFERDLLDRGDDFWFLSLDELTALLRDRDAAPELPATIDSRRQAFERMLSGQARQPLHLRGSTPLAEEPPRPPAPGAVLAATPMSAGEATGTARVVRHLDQIERLGRGDVLVCAATDPGWSSAFLVANAVIVEHGGGLSFAGRMSREHSLPAVALPHATELIADGATVSVDGGRGSVALGTAPPERSTSREGSRLHS